MLVRFENYDHSFLLGGRSVFKPSDLGKRIGYDIKAQVEEAVEFDAFVYHLREGGHVAGLHSHRDHRFFARVDIERYFYNVGRNRVTRALRSVGIPRPEHYAKWSCVKNPYEEPSYALPYGFVQSPILATLVLMHSAVGDYLRAVPKGVVPSVYMDDISISSNDIGELHSTFDGLRDALSASNFKINDGKLRPPSAAIDLFNCDLSFSRTEVRDDRRTEFYSEIRSAASQAAFERYCASIEQGNAN